VDFERHLVSVGSGSGAHFHRGAYIIDLTQYSILEYTFTRWSSQQNMLCQQNLTSPQNAGDDSAKMCSISKRLMSQQKYAVSAKTCRVSKMTC